MVMSRQREIYGAVLSPLVPVVLFLPLGLASDSFQWNFVIIGFTIAVSYASMIFVGLPLVITLKHLGMFTFPWLALFGGGAGIIGLYLAMSFLGTILESSAAYDFRMTIVGAILGMCTALSYGLIAGITKQSRPTR